jgi:hypothetical protein
MPLPVPWIGPGSYCDATDLDKILDFLKSSPNTEQNAQLIETLHRAISRSGMLPLGLDIPRHVRCAQLMLEMAVEWRMPDIERWAVAWLAAADGRHLRLRWSSRSRDGRFRQETRTASRIRSLAADHDRVVLGLASGSVVSWDLSGEQRQVLPSAGFPVWAVAARDQRVVAAGPRNGLATRGWSPAPPALPPPVNGIQAAAIGSGGEIVLGDESGRVQMWAPGDRIWTELCGGSSRRCGRPGEPCASAGIGCAGTGEQVRAVTFAGSLVETVAVAWASGEVSKLSLGAGQQNWRRLHSFGAPIGAAQWSRDGAVLAVAVGRAVWLIRSGGDGDARALPVWTQDGVRAVAWSSVGALASASKDQIYSTVVPVPADGTMAPAKSITSDGEIDAIALPGRGYAVSVWDDELVQWDLSGAGSEDPTYSANDPITAVGVRPGYQGRVRTLVGTRRGRLHTYDATGTRIVQDQLASQPKIKELAWSERDDCWLVATLDGLYAYSPHDGRPGGVSEGERLDAGLCLHVAAAGERSAYAIEEHLVTSDAGNLTMGSDVAGLRFDAARGTLAAIDQDGSVVLLRRGQAEPERRSTLRGTRLLAVRDGSQLLVQDPSGGIRWTSSGGEPPRTAGQSYSGLPDGALGAVPYDAERIVVRYPEQGILLTGPGAGERSWVSARAEVIAVGARRVVVATQYHVAGYDVLDQRSSGGAIDLAVRSAGTGFEVTLPEGQILELDSEALGSLRDEAPAGMEYPSQSVRDLSEAVFRAGQLGDLLWQAGLDLAVDQARGPDPNRPVQLRWNCPPGDRAADLFPWELLHPSDVPLGWFGEPPVTTVRGVEPAGAGRQRRAANQEDPTMLVIRGANPELSAVDNAFDRFRRRTRQTQVRLLKARPQPVSDLDGLSAHMARPVDILQLWAHSGDSGVQLSPGGKIIPTADIADCLAQSAPRLVVLVGCSSGALGRSLVGRGVSVAVAMRVPVFDHTIQPLVEDVTATVLAGTAVDLAFAAALRRYLFTGQPGAAAVPMLYLAGGCDGVLFPRGTQNTNSGN